MLAAARIAQHALRLAHLDEFFMRCSGQFDAGARLTHSAELWRERRIAALAGRQTLTGRTCRLHCVSDFPRKNSCLKLQKNLTKTLRFVRDAG
jgi:hypothetical protein